jgi:DNA-binding phage protein
VPRAGILPGMIDEIAIRSRYKATGPCLDERGRRLFAAAEARAAGHGGIAAVSRATGIARSTIGRGLDDLGASAIAGAVKVRRAGGGRRSLVENDATLLDDLRRLVEPATLGDPMRPLLWVSKSHEKLAAALCTMGHAVSASSIPKLLEELNYRRQVNRKSKEGSRHPDRDGQFEHINEAVIAMQAAGQPVISVDTKKKELIGNYKNPGSDYRLAGAPDEVKVHDFVDKELGKAIPYGVYDLAADAGCVSVGVDHDTAEFAVNAIARWYETMGKDRYPAADRLNPNRSSPGSAGEAAKV